MERELQIQYSYLEHLGDTLNGNFYRSMDSSLSEIIVLYRNKTRGTTNRFINVNDFIDNYYIILNEKIKTHYALLNWRKGTKSIISAWKQRVSFLIENRKDILITLLNRKDFDSREAISEAILSIHDWLCTLEKNDDIADWILNIEEITPCFQEYMKSKSDFINEANNKKSKTSTVINYNYCPEIPKVSKSDSIIETKNQKNKISTPTNCNYSFEIPKASKSDSITETENQKDKVPTVTNHIYFFERPSVPKTNSKIEANSQKNKVSTKTQITHFWKLFKGDEIEQKRKFNNLIEILISNNYISSTDNVGKYQWKLQGNGGRLQIAGLYFVLKNHFTKVPTAVDGNKLIEQWLIHNFKSLIKLLHKKNQDTFKDETKSCHGKYDYIKDFEKILSNL
jgi:hypothetical protein